MLGGACHKLTRPEVSTFKARNRTFHRMLVGNVTVADAGFFERLSQGPPYPASDVPARDDYPNCLTS